MSFLSYLINGLSLGSVYAIIALGYTMVYGIAKMLNFAHGDVIMVGAYMALMAMTRAGLSPIIAVLIAVVVCTVLGVLIERIAYKPLRNAASSLSVLITAIGVSYLLQNLALLIFGSNTQTFPSVVEWTGLTLAGGQLNIPGVTVVTIVVCLIIMAVLILFVQKSKAGQAMRAVSEDRGAAQLMGINVNATIALTFAIGSALAAVAGVLYCSAYPSVTPYTGAMPGIKAFVAAVLWRNRFNSGSFYRRASPGRHRNLRPGVHYLADGGRSRVRRPHHCAPGKAYRAFRQKIQEKV